MSAVITTAGLEYTPAEAAKPSRRREILRQARAIMRNPESTDEQYEDALDTVSELSKFEE